MKRIWSILLVIIAGVFLVNMSSNQKDSVKNNLEDGWAFYNPDQLGISERSRIDIGQKAENYHCANEDTIVAVVDTGIDMSCKLLQNRIIVGWDFYNDDNTIYDDYLYDYHGTYIANMIAKVSSNTKILSVKFMEGTNGCVEDSVSAIRYAIDHGAKIINCSWNTSEDNKQLYDMISDHQEILFVCAAGNIYQDLDQNELYPATYTLDNIISVMAINQQGEVYMQSGYGKNNVDIAAPGEYVRVILPSDDVDYVDGTSVAAAFVSSAAAMLLSYNEDLSPMEIKQLLIDSANKMTTLSNYCVSGGCIDIGMALQLSKGGRVK